MKQILSFLFLLLFANFFYTASAQQYQYTFTGNLNEFSGGPALTETFSCGATGGTYTSSQTIVTPGGTCTGTSTVFSFKEGGGLLFANNPSFISNSYTIHAFFKFLPWVGGYGRIIDFSNSTSDAGIYVLGNCLNFYPNGNVGTCPFVDGYYFLISLVRDGATNQIKVYVNGNVFSTYSDVAGTYKPPTSTTPIIFFRDDNPVPCEDRAGNVKYISLSPAVSSDGQVAAVFANICAAVALPVTLVSFDVTKVSQSNIRLDWKIEQEINISAYYIERSNDGINFQSIGRVNPAGYNSSIKNYSFIDALPATGVNYYRIRILDRDNSIKYSAVKNIRNIVNADLAIFPSPVSKELILNINSESAAKGSVMIFDLGGRQLRNEQIAVSKGFNKVVLDASLLSKGTYQVKVNLNGNTTSKKFTKL